MYSLSGHRVDLNSSGMQESFCSPGISSPEGKGLEYFFLSKGEENHVTNNDYGFVITYSIFRSLDTVLVMLLPRAASGIR